MRREKHHGLQIRNFVSSSGSVSGCAGAVIFFQVRVDGIAGFVNALAEFQAGRGDGRVDSPVNG